ncbi:hypothetical protein B0J11DRAFT_528976 [Dendryphion nanum]|uniref:Uncharacterized protein n=1 Tax=Dendryphion nanum TaxID=256645 RepID=A0A9P9DUU0_9PLEO|nr:hypothetical protein B0J11DRAFT_528976 [Dendryphion nanum]
MSSNQQSSSTFKSFSSSSFSSTINGETTSRSQQSYSDPSGTHVQRSSQNPGQAPVKERIEYDSSGRRVEEVGKKGRIEDVTDRDEQSSRDREYEEKMEEEYAKREGGA